MSVIMTLRLKADAGKLEAWADTHQDTLSGIREKAEGHGLIAHRFYADDDGNVMVMDDWPDQESFQTFFSDSQAEIGPMMAAADAQGEPEIRFWHQLQTHDEYGWGA